jgi:hypothetical protein
MPEKAGKKNKYEHILCVTIGPDGSRNEYSHSRNQPEYFCHCMGLIKKHLLFSQIFADEIAEFRRKLITCKIICGTLRKTLRNSARKL